VTLAKWLCAGAAAVLLAAPTAALAQGYGNDRGDDSKGGAQYDTDTGPDDSDQSQDWAPDSSRRGPQVDTSVVPDDDYGKVVNHTITNGPVPDTPRSRARYGGPDSNGGADTDPAGN
jgi:hypothetical protein